ncbi:hypothetical protein Ae168Ps1_5267c [Pseudonocardia sp. Ae168_Ps1]|nr:hypothetical protein Ae150APs1_5225c [Pseudonocardia sp. Ae150A_Ps1]OLL82861.1 hypothetical protein Ae168Ps1_5267c [Pseudonocardia sp. Ae168_Ps1]OLL83027.1 hypothetical protein Ae263Ps1_0082 [Pseudonocardia sp. Ae263_Ps1]OLL90934.1 hypothetical protein Ae356Ps1_0831c [Pseudonocardia sp. Ae356_Ps1]
MSPPPATGSPRPDPTPSPGERTRCADRSNHSAATPSTHRPTALGVSGEASGDRFTAIITPWRR